ncbi:MAG: hypothetical protein WAM42_00885 [Candidatus Nitrosopolaris sp.]
MEYNFESALNTNDPKYRTHNKTIDCAICCCLPTVISIRKERIDYINQLLLEKRIKDNIQQTKKKKQYA